MRPTVDPQLDRVAYLREVVLLVNALVHFMKTRRPRSNADQCIKPQSALNILLGAEKSIETELHFVHPPESLEAPTEGVNEEIHSAAWPSLTSAQA